MGKLLFWLLIAMVAVFAFRAMRRRNLPPPKTPGEVEDMVRCKVCGVNLPRSEAILSRGQFYCSQAHRIQDQGQDRG